MRDQKQLGFSVIDETRHIATLDLVVPFTTPELTLSAFDAARCMAAGLNATIRLLNVHLVPYPLDPDQAPVSLEFLQQQLAQFQSRSPIRREIRLARAVSRGIAGALRLDSVVVLAAPRRPWKTRNERLAASLRQLGHKVILVQQETANG